MGNKLVNGVRFELTQAELDARQAELESYVEPIPAQIGMDQAQLALHDEGLTEAVELAIDALPVGQQKRVKIEWNTRTTVRRNRGLVSKVLNAAGLSETDIDNLFILANSL